ncbi:MAG: hypothetical protein JW889_07915 [Verrucomicrobia bacterium]|nr:hypothetical protein [Verrucomicrobiota bacterium]
MADTVWGEVQRVLGPDTFEMLVTREGNGNAFRYGPMERIRISALIDDGATRVPDPDRKRLSDKHVRCAILGRDSRSTLIADVTVL